MRMFLFSSPSPRQRLAMAPETGGGSPETLEGGKAVRALEDKQALLDSSNMDRDGRFSLGLDDAINQEKRGPIRPINEVFDAKQVKSISFTTFNSDITRTFNSNGGQLQGDKATKGMVWSGYEITNVEFFSDSEQARLTAAREAGYRPGMTTEELNRMAVANSEAGRQAPEGAPMAAPATEQTQQLDQQRETTTDSTRGSIIALHDNVEGSTLDEAGRTNIRELAKALGVHTEHAEGVAGDKNAAILVDAITMLRESGVSEADICTRMQVAVDAALLSDHFDKSSIAGVTGDIKVESFASLAAALRNPSNPNLAPLLTRFFSNVSPLQLLSGNSTFFYKHKSEGGQLLDKPQTLGEVRDQATDKPDTKGGVQVLLESAGMRSDFAKALTLPERLINWSTLDVRSDILDPRKGAFGTELKHEQVAAFINATDFTPMLLQRTDGRNTLSTGSVEAALTTYLNERNPNYLQGVIKERSTTGNTSFERTTTDTELAEQRQKDVAAIALRLALSTNKMQENAPQLDPKTAMLLSVGLNMQKAVLDDIKTVDGAVSPVLLAPGIKLERSAEGNESRRANGLWLDSGKADSPAARFLAERGMNMNAELDEQDKIPDAEGKTVQKKITIDMPKLFRNRQRETNDTTATKVKEELVIYMPKGAIEGYRQDIQEQIDKNSNCTLQLRLTGKCTTEVRHTRSKGAETTEMFISSDVAEGGQYEGIRITLDNGQLKMGRSTVDRTLPAMDADIKDRYIAQHGGADSGKGVGDVASVYTAEAIEERQETFIPAGVDTFNVLGGGNPPTGLNGGGGTIISKG